MSQLSADPRKVAHARRLVMGVADLMKINEIHRGDHIADQGHLSDLRLAAHRCGHCNGAGRTGELGLPGVEKSRREEPTAHGNVPSTLTAQGTDSFRGRRPGASRERRHTRQPVVRRPLPGSPRDQGIAPDVAAASRCEDQSIEL